MKVKAKVVSNNPLVIEPLFNIKTQREFKVGCTYLFNLDKINTCKESYYKIIKASIIIPLTEEDYYDRQEKSRGLIKGV